VKEIQRDMAEYLKLKCQIILVSFGNTLGASKWLNEMTLSNDENIKMITDETRSLYKLFGIYNSYAKVWNSETLIYYAEQVCMKRDLPKAYKDVEDDPHQMGGKYINLKFRLISYSENIY
jgi:hypothetical protein